MAWVLACGTFPLIWVGGLVTTYDAGMAVPDWPNTYGYNLFLYPLESWLKVWDLFLEHSHRLLGAAVGMVAIALLVLLCVFDRRTWMRWMGAIALVVVSAQGTLGGLRVLGDEIFLAKVHGCSAPVFFAFAAALVTFTSARWSRPPADRNASAHRIGWLSLAATGLCYGQIVLGAQLRHLARDGSPRWFELWVWLHLIGAGLLLVSLAWLAVVLVRNSGGERTLIRRAWLLVGLFAAQLILGCATWVLNYNWPAWFLDYFWAVEYTVLAEGRLQAMTTTAHVAVGSLCLVTALSLSLWSYRLGVQDLAAPPSRRKR
jgi:cytochrome c oxidase assembly protein subunit 15